MNKRTMAIARATGMIGATAALVVGVTFAALTSTATLSGNTLSSATAGLKIWNGATFESTASGFTVTNLVPGTGQEFAFYLKNEGGVPLAITAAVPELPLLTGITSSDYTKVKISITNDKPGCGTQTVDTTLQALWAAPVSLTCNPLSAGAQGNSSVATEGNYRIKFDIDPAGISGSQAEVASFNVVFTGTQP